MINRRGAISLIAAAPISSALAGNASAQEATSPGAPNHQLFSAYRTNVGDARVTVLGDGYLNIARESFLGVEQSDLQRIMADNFVVYRETGLRVGINAYLVEHAGHTTLIDAGAADLLVPLGARAGLLAQSLASVGVSPESVNTVLVTHLHPDHAGGLVVGDNPMFPKAKLAVSETDLKFWTSEELMSQVPDFMKPWLNNARAIERAYPNRQLHNGSGEVAPGITAVATPGHTPGHTAYMLDFGGEQLLVVGDVVTSSAYSFSNPDIGLIFDVDAGRAAETRKSMLAMIASDRLRISGTHIAFPSVGHVVTEGNSYRFIPDDWDYEL
jgi:glyoxylase-like metal-dependent hydrolase (beta-lactamase superfamily II)